MRASSCISSSAANAQPLSRSSKSPKAPTGKFSGKVDSASVEALASSVFDNGRRGMPKPGCDCVQCFGYCLVDQDEAMRARFEGVGPVQGAGRGALNFEEAA